MRTVKYEIDIEIRGYGYNEPAFKKEIEIGFFHSFFLDKQDYVFAIIETKEGYIIERSIRDIQFIKTTKKP